MRSLKLIFLIFCLFFIKQINAQTKHALILAIGNYPKANGWPTISSIRDVGFVDSALVKQGFHQKNITIVTDSEATPKGIETAIRSLINTVKPGDVVVIHVSSHGEQIADDNHDEADGLDEAIVTYNAVSPYNFKRDSRGNLLSIGDYNKAQAEYFRDDLFGSLINDLRLKLGKEGDVLVFMDLCHSGTGLRGIAKVRGGQPALVPPDFNAKQSRDTAEYIDRSDKILDENSLATYVAVSAARADELDYESYDENGKGMGSLSYAVSKVFQKLDIGTTYRTLFSKIEAVMHEKAPFQHPMLEGNGIDRKLFGGDFVSQKNYIEIKDIQGLTLTLNSGLFAGLDIGAEIAVYPVETLDPANATMLASGKIISAKAYTSIATLKTKLKLLQPSLGRVFITKPVYNVKSIALKIQPMARGVLATGYSPSEISAIKKNLSHLPIISFTGNPQLQLVKGGKDSIKFVETGFVFAVVDNSTSNTNALTDALQRYAQYKFLTDLQINDPDINIEVRLVPYVNGKADTAAVKVKVINEFGEGDKFVLWVNNKSKSDVYINILDIQPDGIINSVFPFKKKGIEPGDLKIQKGETHLFSNYPITVSPPYGIEVFKIFASKELIDIEDLATTRGIGTRGSLSVLETLLQKSYNSRGAGPEDLSNKDGSTYNLVFQINPKK